MCDIDLEELIEMDKQVTSAIKNTLRKVEKLKLGEERSSRHNSLKSSTSSGSRKWSSSEKSLLLMINITPEYTDPNQRVPSDDSSNHALLKYSSDPTLETLYHPPRSASTPLHPTHNATLETSIDAPKTFPLNSPNTPSSDVNINDLSSTPLPRPAASDGSETSPRLTSLKKNRARDDEMSSGRSHSVTFLLNSPLQTHDKCASADSILEDINYLNKFRKKISTTSSASPLPLNLANSIVDASHTKEDKPPTGSYSSMFDNVTPTAIAQSEASYGSRNESKTGRYSLVDRNLHAVDDRDHVITDLWNISNQKVSLAMVGHMNSCQEEDTIIDCSTINDKNNRHVNYKDALIPLEGKLNESDNSDSGNDTDDLIEDARDFVRIGQRKLVTLDDWEKIDYNRKERRRLRLENGVSSREDLWSKADWAQENPFLPRSLTDLRLGCLVKLLLPSGCGALFGIVRYLGEVDSKEKVGVELKQRKGNTDGTYKNQKYFNCDSDYGVFLPIDRVLLAWSSPANQYFN